MAPAQNPSKFISARLGLWDTVSIIVGIIVGVGIFETPGIVFQSAAAPWQVLGLWLLGGILSLIGALCYAELASSYPRSGGEYVYLARAYGPPVAFLFAWGQLAVIRTGGGIAAVAYIFGERAASLSDAGAAGPGLYAAGAIVVLSLINILGTIPGKHTQNVLTVAKVVGLGAIVAAGFLVSRQPAEGDLPAVVADPSLSFALAMIFVLYAYDGWNEAAYVSAEVQNARRNLPLALILGTLAVTVIYLLVNVAYLTGLGFEGAQAAGKPGVVLVSQAWGAKGGLVLTLLIMISALGTANGTIFTAARLYAALGRDHRLFAPLGWWNRILGTPVWSLVIQALISIGLVAGVGMAWQGQSGFQSLLQCTAPVFWLFFLLTGLSLFVLRRLDPDIERPFRVPLYPVLPLIFCSWCGYMLYGSLRYAREEAFVGLVILLAGVPLYLLSQRLDRRRLVVDAGLSSDSLVTAAPVSHSGDQAR